MTPTHSVGLSPRRLICAAALMAVAFATSRDVARAEVPPGYTSGPVVSFKFSNYGVNENAQTVKVQVVLSEVTDKDVTVKWKTDDRTGTGVATAGDDYVSANGTVTIKAGDSEGEFEVTIKDDQTPENDEYFVLALYEATNAVIGAPDTAEVTIYDDEIVPVISFESASYTVAEREGKVEVVVVLTPPCASQVTVLLSTAKGTALPVDDYEELEDYLITFPPWETAQTVPITIVNDELDTADETFSASLHSASANATIGASSTSVTIQPSPDKRDKEDEVDIEIYDGNSGQKADKDLVPVPQKDEDDIRGAVTVANLNDTNGNWVVDKDDPIVLRAETELAADVDPKALDTLKVKSVKGYQKGDRIAIRKGEVLDSGENAKVKEVKGADTIILEAALKFAYKEKSKVYHPGRDEMDLMKIVLKKPNPDNGGKVELWKKSGDVKLWKYSWKETEEKLTNDKIEYETKNLPVTLYVEALSKSTKLRDIEFRLTYGAKFDTVKATAMWVEPTKRLAGEGTNPWFTRQDASGWPHNPAPGQKHELTDFRDNNPSTLIALFRAVKGSRYGHGQIGDGKGQERNVGGRILWEFTPVPAGVEKLKGVVFDLTRQAHGQLDVMPDGGDKLTYLEFKLYPWQESPPRDDEYPNDDNGPNLDAQVVPVNGKMYIFDGPSLPFTLPLVAGGKGTTFARHQANFYEWARVRFDDPISFTFGLPLLQESAGTRASDRQGWYAATYGKRASLEGDWLIDKDAVTLGLPLYKSTNTDKKATAELLDAALAKTEGFTTTYDGAGKWQMKSTAGGDSGAVAEKDGKWVVEIAKKVRLTIPNDGAFQNGDVFTFTVFVQATKPNIIDLGQKATPGLP